MNCQTTKEQISQFLDNELRSEELQPMFLHLSECEECRTFFIRTKKNQDGAKSIKYVAAPEVIDQKFAVLGMEHQQKSILSRQFTFSVSSVITSVGAVIAMVLFIYVSGTIQEKQIAEQYRQTMDLSMPYGTSSIDRN